MYVAMKDKPTQLISILHFMTAKKTLGDKTDQ